MAIGHHSGGAARKESRRYQTGAQEHAGEAGAADRHAAAIEKIRQPSAGDASQRAELHGIYALRRHAVAG
jgi:hypothetical protein